MRQPLCWLQVTWSPTFYPLSATVALSPGLLNCLHLPLLTPEFQRHLGAHLGLSVIKYAYFLKPKVFSLNVISGKLFYRKWKSKINTLRCHPVPPGQLFTALQQNKLTQCGTWFSCGVSRIRWTPATTLDPLLDAVSTPHLTAGAAGVSEQKAGETFMVICSALSKGIGKNKIHI